MTAQVETPDATSNNAEHPRLAPAATISPSRENVSSQRSDLDQGPQGPQGAVDLRVTTRDDAAEPPPLARLPPPKPGPGSDWIRKGDPRSLELALRDFRRFTEALPIPVVRLVPRAVARILCKALASRGLMASNLAFDVALVFWRIIINIFFRSIQPRSAWRIPHEGPLIFVAAPHHNQFLDPLLLASEVRRGSGRRVAFLIAEKSIKRRFVGAAARFMQSIPVARAADAAKPGKGKISLSPDDPCIILGHGSQFTEQLVVRGQIVLPKATGHASAEIVEILSDTKLRIKKEFKDHRAIDALNGKEVKEEKRGSKSKDADHSDSAPVKPETSPSSPDTDGVGCKYQVLPFVDQTEMYASVYERLAEGGCLGIFPEGGSHDRTDLLPLKAGVVIMALGAMSANPGLKVRIVPVGLSYFHPHKFRSRAVVEFGEPLDVPKDMVELFEKGGENKRKAVSKMMEIVYDGLKSVTVRAPDYETLMLIQAIRRLYTPPGSHPSLSQVVELNRRFILGYLKFQDDPRIKKLKDDVMRYNKRLIYVGLKDHQVERATRAGWRSLGLLAYRIGLLVMWGGLALPGVILNSPIIILAKIISHRKAKEALAASQVKLEGRDVLATWKVLVSLGVTPLLYCLYAGVMTYVAHRYKLPLKHRLYMPAYVFTLLPIMSYSTLKFSEVGIDIYKSLPPLFVSLLPGNHKVIMELQDTRVRITRQVHDLIDELAPQIWDDFKGRRIFSAPLATPPPLQTREDAFLWRQKTRDKRLDGTSPLSHPLAWVDERLFGWGTKRTHTTKALSVAEFQSDRGRRSTSQTRDGSERSSSRDGKASSTVYADEEEDGEDVYFSSAEEGEEEEEEEEGDYETIFRMLTKPFMGYGDETKSPKSPRSPQLSRRSSARSRSHSRTNSNGGAGSGGGGVDSSGLGGQTFAEKRNRSGTDLRALSMTSPGQNSSTAPNGRDTAEARTSALAGSPRNGTPRDATTDAGAQPHPRRTRTHSLSEEVRVADVFSQGVKQAAPEEGFEATAQRLEQGAARSRGIRPTLGEMRSADATPDMPGTPKKRAE